MFNVGGPEVMVIIVIALLVLGPDQLPKAMRTLGNAREQFRKVSGGIQDEIKKAMDAAQAAPESLTSSPRTPTEPAAADERPHLAGEPTSA